MENLIVATFLNIQDATEGLNKIKELDGLGEITIYNVLMVRKRSETKFELLFHNGLDISDMPPYDEMAGLLFSTIDEPIKLAVALFSGFLNVKGDQHMSGDFSTDLLGQFKRKLQLGIFTLLLDVEGDNEFIINRVMKTNHGIAFSTDIIDLYQEYIRDQWQRIHKEIKYESLNIANEELSTELKAEKVILKKKMEGRIAEMREQVFKIKSQLNDRIEILGSKIKSTEINSRIKLIARKKELEIKVEKINRELSSFIL
jgi:hypothetical protein